MSARTIISHLSGRQVEAFYLLLVTSGDYTFLPEIYDIFGREDTIKFLELFSGYTIKVPSADKLEILARDASIYVRIKQVSPGMKPSVIKDLADDFDITEDRVRSIYDETAFKLEKKLGFKVSRVKKRF